MPTFIEVEAGAAEGVPHATYINLEGVDYFTIDPAARKVEFHFSHHYTFPLHFTSPEHFLRFVERLMEDD